jgi:hypothetical protein
MTVLKSDLYVQNVSTIFDEKLDTHQQDHKDITFGSESVWKIYKHVNIQDAPKTTDPNTLLSIVINMNYVCWLLKYSSQIK